MTKIYNDVSYCWFTFDQLSPDDMYAILQLRQQVFVVEQNCPYLDADGLDQHAWHLLARIESGDKKECTGYLRVIFPGKKYREPAIGRVLTSQAVRGRGIGRELMREAFAHLAREYPGQPLRISAQLYLRKFYTELGFAAVTEPYDDDGIPHIEMMRDAC